mmetsp:Transcript_55075/g.128878  ORF Transcript_55075/g.128878 Transcript_55075/m.128878 type:complete len:838 (+) Transcript_55075:178-2691(+)
MAIVMEALPAESEANSPLPHPDIPQLHGDFGDAEDALEAAHERITLAKADELERRISEQNHLFWESAKRKDDQLVILQEECKVVRSQLRQEEAAAQGCQSVRICEAKEAELDAARLDLQAARSRSIALVQQQASIIETMSGQICKAREDRLTAEAARSEVAAQMAEVLARDAAVQSELSSSHAEATELETELAKKQADAAMSKHEEAEASAYMAKLEEELSKAQLGLQGAEDAMKRGAMGWRQRLQGLHSARRERMAEEAEQIRRAAQEQSMQESHCQGLKQKLQAAQAKRDQEVTLLEDAVRLAKQRNSHDLSASEGTQASSAKGELEEAKERQAQLKEALRAARSRYQARRQKMLTQQARAGEAARTADIARRQVLEAQEKLEAASNKAAAMQKDLAEAKKRHAAEMGVVEKQRSELLAAENLRIEQSREEWRSKALSEEQHLRDAVAKAEARAVAVQAEASQATEEEATLRLRATALNEEASSVREEVELARQRRSEQEEVHARRHIAILRDLASWKQEFADGRTSCEKSEAEAQEMEQEAKLAKKQMAIELKTESSACVTWREKCSKAQAEVQQMQEKDAERMKSIQAVMRELAAAREEAGSHGRAATEMRAELVLRDHEGVGKHAGTQRELDYVQQELRISRDKLTLMQKQCSTAETELAASRASQERLESELHDAVEQLSELRKSEDLLWANRLRPAETSSGPMVAAASSSTCPAPGVDLLQASLQPLRSRSIGTIGTLAAPILSQKRSSPTARESAGRAQSVDAGRLLAFSYNLPIRRAPPPLPPLPAGSLPCSPSSAHQPRIGGDGLRKVASPYASAPNSGRRIAAGSR